MLDPKKQAVDLVEEWRDIADYEGLYQVSNLGRVKSLDKVVRCFEGSKAHKGRILKLKNDKDGYLLTNLSHEGLCITRRVHHLVLEAFVGPCPKGMVCRHFPDRDPSNNNLSNLSWATSEQNAQDRRTHGTQVIGELQHFSKLTAEDVADIRTLYIKGGSSRFGGKGFALSDLAREFDVTVSTIHAIIHRKIWSHVP